MSQWFFSCLLWMVLFMSFLVVVNRCEARIKTINCQCALVVVQVFDKVDELTKVYLFLLLSQPCQSCLILYHHLYHHLFLRSSMFLMLFCLALFLHIIWPANTLDTSNLTLQSIKHARHAMKCNAMANMKDNKRVWTKCLDEMSWRNVLTKSLESEWTFGIRLSAMSPQMRAPGLPWSPSVGYPSSHLQSRSYKMKMHEDTIARYIKIHIQYSKEV